MDYRISDHIQLHHTDLAFAADLLALTEANREHLSQFLPWVPFMQTVAHFEAYIQRCITERMAGQEESFVIVYDGKVAGRIGLHYINMANKKGEIGYWLGEAFVGRGIISESLTWLVERGFSHHGLHRLELKAQVANLRSCAVAERFGFQQEGVLRQAEWVNCAPHDLNLYSLLKTDWEAMKNG